MATVLDFSLAVLWAVLFSLKVMALAGLVPLATVDGGLDLMAVIYAMAAATFLWWLSAICRSDSHETRLLRADLAGRAHAMGLLAIIVGLVAGFMAPVEAAPGQGISLLAALSISAWLAGRLPDGRSQPSSRRYGSRA